MTRKLGLGILMAMMAATAFARNDDNQGNDNGGDRGNKRGEKQHVSAPEIDPASAMAGLTLMVSGLAVVRGRRKIK